jgi:hypothetical protein
VFEIEIVPPEGYSCNLIHCFNATQIKLMMEGGEE